MAGVGVRADSDQRAKSRPGAGQDPVTCQVIIRIGASTLSEMMSRCRILSREATYFKLHFKKSILKLTTF